MSDTQEITIESIITYAQNAGHECKTFMEVFKTIAFRIHVGLDPYSIADDHNYNCNNMSDLENKMIEHMYAVPVDKLRIPFILETGKKIYERKMSEIEHILS